MKTGHRTRATFTRDRFRSLKAIARATDDIAPGGTVKVTVRYRPSELASLRRQAKMAGTNLADYIRTKSLQ